MRFSLWTLTAVLTTTICVYNKNVSCMGNAGGQLRFESEPLAAAQQASNQRQQRLQLPQSNTLSWFNVDNETRPGDCPASVRPQGGSLHGSICDVLCMSDGECPMWQKCCYNGCGQQCLVPLNKPGICPTGIQRTDIDCESQRICTDDSQCVGNWKCCDTPQACKIRICVNPRVTTTVSNKIVPTVDFADNNQIELPLTAQSRVLTERFEPKIYGELLNQSTLTSFSPPQGLSPTETKTVREQRSGIGTNNAQPLIQPAVEPSPSAYAYASAPATSVAFSPKPSQSIPYGPSARDLFYLTGTNAVPSVVNGQTFQSRNRPGAAPAVKSRSSSSDTLSLLSNEASDDGTVRQQQHDVSGSCAFGTTAVFEKTSRARLDRFQYNSTRFTGDNSKTLLTTCLDACRDDIISDFPCTSVSMFPFGSASVAKSSSVIPSRDPNAPQCYLNQVGAAPFGSGILTVSGDYDEYYQKYCLSSRNICSSVNQPFTFERWVQKNLSAAPDKTLYFVSKTQCMDACLDERSFVCRSLLYDISQRMCLLLRFSRHDSLDSTGKIIYLMDSYNTEYLENKCAGPNSVAFSLVGASAASPAAAVASKSGRNLNSAVGVASAPTASTFFRPTNAAALSTALANSNLDRCSFTDNATFVKLAGNRFAVAGGSVAESLLNFVKQQQVGLSLDMCRQRCLSDSTCRSFEYYVDVSDNRRCSLSSLSSLERLDLIGADTILTTAEVYDLICVEAPVCTRPYSFERLIGQRGQNFYRQISNVSLRQCMERCLRASAQVSARQQCRSFSYSSAQSNNSCLLSRFDRRSSTANSSSPGNSTSTDKSSLISDDSYDYYENNCYDEPRRCNFVLVQINARIRQGFVDRSVSGLSVAQCETACVNEQTFVCRSFNFRDASFIERSTCELSHHDRRTLDVNNNNQFEPVAGGWSYYERGSCMDVEVGCEADGIRITVKTNQNFNGIIYALNKFDQCFTNGAGGTQNTLLLTAPGRAPPDCNTTLIPRNNGKILYGRFVVQFNPFLETVDDFRFGVTCLYTGEEGQITSGVLSGVTDEIGARGLNGEPLTPLINLPTVSVPLVQASMRIFNERHQSVSNVLVGETVIMEIKSLDSDNPYLFARSCFIMSETGRVQYELIDKNGCPKNRRVFPEFTQIAQGLSTRFSMFKLPGIKKVVFQCLVRYCRKNACSPKPCSDDEQASTQQSYSSWGRKKRDVLDGNNNNQVSTVPSFKVGSSPDARHLNDPYGAFLARTAVKSLSARKNLDDAVEAAALVRYSSQDFRNDSRGIQHEEPMSLTVNVYDSLDEVISGAKNMNEHAAALLDGGESGGVRSDPKPEITQLAVDNTLFCLPRSTFHTVIVAVAIFVVIVTLAACVFVFLNCRRRCRQKRLRRCLAKSNSGTSSTTQSSINTNKVPQQLQHHRCTTPFSTILFAHSNSISRKTPSTSIGRVDQQLYGSLVEDGNYSKPIADNESLESIPASKVIASATLRSRTQVNDFNLPSADQVNKATRTDIKRKRSDDGKTIQQHFTNDSKTSVSKPPRSSQTNSQKKFLTRMSNVRSIAPSVEGMKARQRKLFVPQLPTVLDNDNYGFCDEVEGKNSEDEDGSVKSVALTGVSENKFRQGQLF